MRTLVTIIFISLCLQATVYSQTDIEKGKQFKEQAANSLKQQKYIEARYLFKRAYDSYAASGNYQQAVDCGIRTNALYLRENFYKEAFDLSYKMENLVMNGEQNLQKEFPELHFRITKERMQMYAMLKKTAEANNQLYKLEKLASTINNDSIDRELLYTKAAYYYAFNLKTQGDAAFQQLIRKYKEDKEYEKVSECYRQLIEIAQKNNNASLMKSTYENYITWTDSVKSLTAHDELTALKRKYSESQQTIEEKEDALSAKQYVITGLCVLVVVLIAAAVVLTGIVLRLVAGNRKLKKSMQIANEHNELKTQFIRNISSQMDPGLNTLSNSIQQIEEKVPQEAQTMQTQLMALKNFSDNIQQLSDLENSLTIPYEVNTIDASDFCGRVMQQIQNNVEKGVEAIVSAPKLQIKACKEELEYVLKHLLQNAAIHTHQGHIKLEFKKRGAHTYQFIVTDTGTGIPEELQDNLFKPFTEIKDLTEGDGLGLPICSLMATKMNGTLTLDTAYTKGARFILEVRI